MTKIVVIGAGSLLGRHLVPLLAETADVVAFDRQALDLSRPIDAEVLPSKIQAVIYLAQSNRFREFPEAADDVFRLNTAQPLALLDYARRAGATNFVYASTGGVYGTGGPLLAEDAPTPPPGQRLGFYPASKLATEVLARAYEPYLNVASLRYFFIYGAQQKPGMLIPRIVDSVRTGRPILLHGANGLHINPVHASDAARATIAAVWLDNSVTINVAGSQVLSLRAIGEMAGRLLGREPVFEVVEAAEPLVLTADIKRMQELLVDPTCDFKTGLTELIAADGDGR